MKHFFLVITVMTIESLEGQFPPTFAAAISEVDMLQSSTHLLYGMSPVHGLHAVHIWLEDMDGNPRPDFPEELLSHMLAEIEL